MSARRTVVTRLRRILDARRDREADLRPRRVLGRFRDGTEALLPLDGECPERGGLGRRAVGQIVLLPAPPAFRDQGAAGVAVAGETAGSGLLWIERQEPRAFVRGMLSPLTVTITGRGLRPETWLEYRLPTGETHAGLAILQTTWIDAETLALEVEVAPDARLTRGAPIAYAGSPPMSPDAATLRDDFYDVEPTLEPVGAEHFAYVPAGGDLVQLALYRGGRWLRDLGAPQVPPPLPTPVVRDGSGTLEPGAMVGGLDGHLVAVDFAAGTRFEHSVEGGFAAAPPMLVDGAVWWLERSASAPAGQPLPVRLRRASPRFDEVETLGTGLAPFVGSDAAWLDGFFDPLFTPASAAAIVIAEGEVSTPTQMVFGFDGSVERAELAAMSWRWPGVPTTVGTLVSEGWVYRGSGAPGEEVESWLRPEWGLTGARAGVAGNRSRVVCYGRRGGERFALHSGLEPGAEPDAEYLVEPHPALGVRPTVFWPAF